MNKQTGLLAGTTIFFITAIIIFAGRFATSVIVARTLGPTFKGIYNLTLLTSGLVIMVINFGLNGAIAYLVASKKYSSQQLFSFAVLAGLILCVIGGGIFYLAYNRFLINNILEGSDRNLILWIILGLPLTLIASFFQSLLLGQQRMLAYNSIDITRIISNLGFQIVSSLSGAGVQGAVASWLAANCLAFLLSIYLLRQDFNLRIFQTIPVVNPALRYGGKSYLANLLQFFNLRLDSFLVNFFRGATAVGQYTTSVTFAELLWYVPNAVSSALFPKVSGLSKDTADRVTPQACRQTLLLVFLAAIGLSIAGGWLIVAFYGEAFRPAVAPFMWLLPGMIGISIAKIVSADLSGRGKPQYAAYTAGVTVVITVILDVALIPAYSITGAAIASSVAYLTSGSLSVFWFCRLTGVSPITLLIPRFSDVRLLFDRSLVLAQNIRRFAASRRGVN